MWIKQYVCKHNHRALQIEDISWKSYCMSIFANITDHEKTNKQLNHSVLSNCTPGLTHNWVIASCFDPMIMEKVLSKLWNSICKSVPVHTWYGYVRKTAKSFDDAPKTAKSWDVCNIGLRHNESSRADRAKMNHKPITWEVCVHSGHWDTKESRELLPKDLHPLYS